MRNVRQAQDRNAWVASRLSAQLDTSTVRAPVREFAGGPLPLIARDVAAPPTTIAAQRLLLQSEQVAAELSLSPRMAGPGTV